MSDEVTTPNETPAEEAPAALVPTGTKFADPKELDEIDGVHVVGNGVGYNTIIVNAATGLPIGNIAMLRLIITGTYPMAAMDIVVGTDEIEVNGEKQVRPKTYQIVKPVIRMIMCSAPSVFGRLKRAGVGSQWWNSALHFLRSCPDVNPVIQGTEEATTEKAEEAKDDGESNPAVANEA